jgi:type I restriction enzyme S subunit
LAKISSEEYINDYLFYFLQSKYKVLNSNPRGVGIPHIEPNLLWNFEIPDIDKTTQHQIVSRIESLFAELDKAVEHLRTAQQQLKTYRQAVLNHWLNNEDGKWERKTAEECVVDENYSLAIGPFGSDLKVEDYTESGVKLVFVRDITSKFEDKINKFVSEYKADQLKAHNVFKGDLLITKMGDPPGQTGIFPFDRGVITSDVLRMKTNDKILNKYYAMYYILSSEGGKQIKEMTQGVAQKKISLGRFKKFLFPIPSISEQQRIVEEIETRLSQTEAARARIAEALQKTEALRQSILKKAFSGELV